VLAAALEEPVPLEGDQVMMDGAGGCEADGVGDLPDRGWIATLLDPPRDEVDDSLSPLHVMPGHRAAP
jgi:hypothetical protein